MLQKWDQFGGHDTDQSFLEADHDHNFLKFYAFPIVVLKNSKGIVIEFSPLQ